MKKILLIEDNKELRENVAELLELSDYEVFEADNGIKGVEQALQHKPDLILCDILMPSLDGFGVLHMVQKKPELQHTSFIFLTALNDSADLRKGMMLGADDYITKPFDNADLLNAIEVRLHKAEINQHTVEDCHCPDKPHHLASAEKTMHAFVDGRKTDFYKKKQRIFSEGNHPIRLYYVEKGSVKLYKTNNDGKELIVNIVHEREFFGHAALIRNSPYMESAEALENSEIATIPKKEFDQLLLEHPEAAIMFLKLLANEVMHKEEQLVRIAYNSLRRKVADALLTVFESSPEKPHINISRDNLAAVAGTATESLIRTLTDFKAEKIIDIAEGKIFILNRDRLERMLN